MARGRLIWWTVAAAVALAATLAGIAFWNTQAVAAEAGVCEREDGAVCIEPESCCAGAEDVLKELGRV